VTRGVQIVVALLAAVVAADEPADGSRFVAGAGTGIGLGLAVGATLGAHLEAGVRFENASLAIEGHVAAAVPAHLKPATRSATGAAIYGLAVACLLPGDVSICAVGGGGFTRTWLGGIARPFAVNLPLALAGARLAYDIPLGDHWRFRMRLDVYFRLAQVQLVVEGAQAWRSDLVAGAFGVGMVRTF
jgi:hypothetical protein